MKPLAEKYELYRFPLYGDFGDKYHGALDNVPGPNKVRLRIIFSVGMDWDHVSVSLPDRCPTWEEMCFVKDMFFEPEDCCVQYHPPASAYRNHHKFCLHIWRPQKVALPMPDPIMVAPEAA